LGPFPPTSRFCVIPGLPRSALERYGEMSMATTLLGQRTVFHRGEKAIKRPLFRRRRVHLEGWWPDSVRKLLGPLSLATATAPNHKAAPGGGTAVRRVLLSSATQPGNRGVVDDLKPRASSSEEAPLAPWLPQA